MKWNLKRWLATAGVLAGSTALLMNAAPDVSDVKGVTTGSAAFASYKDEKPGNFRKITVADLPQPYATKGVSNSPTLVPKPADAWPLAPEGFKVELYAEKLSGPREIRSAPNGDLFVSESMSGEVEVFRGIGSDGKPKEKSTFVTGLKNNFGIAFYPLGANPKWIYLANTHSVVRYPYHNGDLKAIGAPETIIPELPAGGGHWTRDLAFSPDGTKLFVSVG
ncbi:MAG TPA: hypothetical protein VK604_18365, partial [Bryobacteraceae bacterium]|nr:hypothetical protein [Bryobacteraceae bacterium]